MSKHTIVIEFEGRGPAYGANMEALGGKVVSVSFSDEIQRANDLEDMRDDLLEALEDLVRVNEQHNLSIQAVTGKPAGWKDDYLNQARAAIARARGEA